ncbi:lipocalin [Microcaecilia unicolor]|uniref:Lipocalin-like n=1 Tax=Microcaecilia unicolor TaxID=1415580 RepID=A0A6P7YF12_9AMPH|nr:lipocalin-like [Microcaecilia unicolor]
MTLVMVQRSPTPTTSSSPCVSINVNRVWRNSSTTPKRAAMKKLLTQSLGTTAFGRIQEHVYPLSSGICRPRSPPPWKSQEHVQPHSGNVKIMYISLGIMKQPYPIKNKKKHRLVFPNKKSNGINTELSAGTRTLSAATKQFLSWCTKWERKPETMSSILALSVGLLLTCVLQAWADVPPPPRVMDNFDNSQFAGKWYAIAAATNNKERQTMMRGMSLPTFHFELTDDGNFKVDMSFSIGDSCQKQTVLYRTIGKPGTWAYENNGMNGNMGVLETDYKTYCFVMQMDQGIITTTVFGRSPDVSSEILEKYRDLILSRNLTEDDVVMVPAKEGCQPV